MGRLLDLSLVPTAELIEIRNVLKYGAKAYASKAGDEARKLRAENAQLKKHNERCEIVESAGLDWDSDYWLALTEYQFKKTVEMMSEAKRQSALAEKTNTIKIPPIVHAEELPGIELIRQGFKDRKNGHREE